MNTVREATPDDTAELAALYYECRDEADWLPAASKAHANFEHDTDGEKIYVCISPYGRFLGFVSVWMPESFIHHLYVAPHARRLGVGTTLLSALTGQVPQPWSLKCAQANKQAANFYQNKGWEIIDAVPDCDEPYFLFELDESNCPSCSKST